MTFHHVRELAGDPRIRGFGLFRNLSWLTGVFGLGVLAFVLMATPRIAVRAEAEEAAANRVPVQIIRFERGASSKDITGAVIRGERSVYSIDARSGQRLSVTISAAEANAVFQIYPPGAQAEHRDYGVEIAGAKALPGAEEGADAKSWSGVLPETGAYLVVVGPTYGNATYTLSVAIR
jgi:hypothetical protein